MTFPFPRRRSNAHSFYSRSDRHRGSIPILKKNTPRLLKQCVISTRSSSVRKIIKKKFNTFMITFGIYVLQQNIPSKDEILLDKYVDSCNVFL